MSAHRADAGCRLRVFDAAWRALGITVCAVGALVAAPRAQQAPVFRGGAVLVPLDLRVLDRHGQPVTDLRGDEVEVFEDGVAQDIRHFSAQTLAADAAGTGGRPARRQPLSADITPQSRRVFLIVLGRGRLQEPSRGVDALLHFVRERLLPQDQVAVLAYDRATAFTTDHARIAEVLARFRDRHESIEQGLRQRFSGLASVYGNKDLPAPLRAQIDALFLAASGPDTRELPPAPVANDARLAADLRLPFDRFVESNRQTMQDLGNLYTGIEYLRQLDGEKHLIFVTEQGITLPRLEDDMSLAAIASDARVAIEPIQTGGELDAPMPAPAATSTGATAVPAPNAAVRQSLAMVTLRTIADLTGGQASMHAYAEGAIDRINTATRFSYLVGYAPSNTTWDGRYRHIHVTVRRPDVTVFYRHGYYGREQVPPTNRRQFVAASRMNAAVGYRRDIRDIRLKATARFVKGPDGVAGGKAAIEVTLTIDAARVHFDDLQNQRVGTLDVALVCLDARQRVVGQLVEEIRLRQDEAEHQRALRDGIAYAGRVTPTAAAQMVKVVVYDYAADLLGTVVVTVK
jgi:VWFA-related protein